MLLTLQFHGLAALLISGGAGAGAAVLAVVLLVVAKVRTRDSALGVFDTGLGRIAAGLFLSAGAFLVIVFLSSSGSRHTQKLLDDGVFVWTPLLLLLPPLVVWRMRRRGIDWLDEDQGE